mmetsp:Transcript_19145/g.42329  ORF Transcript_19145/g.42329 Transcript_19145/m.42329 type:complete len:102 (-) Transcript_19145:610-915(-)
MCYDSRVDCGHRGVAPQPRDLGLASAKLFSSGRFLAGSAGMCGSSIECGSFRGKGKFQGSLPANLTGAFIAESGAMHGVAAMGFVAMLGMLAEWSSSGDAL